MGMKYTGCPKKIIMYISAISHLFPGEPNWICTVINNLTFKHIDAKGEYANKKHHILLLIFQSRYIDKVDKSMLNY